MLQQLSYQQEFTHGHIFCGSGGGAKGMNRSRFKIGKFVGRLRCIGGVDSDPAAIEDFTNAVGVPGTVRDLFSRDQYIAFHGREPPEGWRQAMPIDIRIAMGGERPNILFLSAPCQGFSGLLAESLSRNAKYEALNNLTLRGIWLALEAYKDDPAEVILFENVPRIAKRGRYLLDQIIALLRAYGYAVAESFHDCGVIGGLGQSRKRFLLIARHAEKVPPFIYEPPRRSLRGVGEIIGRLPVPGPVPALPMHRMPALQWKTWVRLAFVEPGADWRSLNKLRVEDGCLADFGIAPEVGWNHDVLGVRAWDEPSGTITSRSGPTNGRFSVADPREQHAHDFHGLRLNGWSDVAAAVTTQRSPGSSAQSVADPRIDGHAKSVQMGVGHWDRPAAVIKGDVSVGTGRYAVADPRPQGKPHFNNVFRIVPWGGPSGAVTSGQTPSSGGQGVADPRYSNWHPGASSAKMKVTDWGRPGGTVTGAQQVGSGALAVADPRPSQRVDYKQNKYRVTGYDEPAGAVISASTTGNSAYCVADPRPDGLNARRDAYMTGGHYGVVPWERPGNVVSAHGQHDNGYNSVADPRDSTGAEGDVAAALPNPDDRLVCFIRARDNTWHRPFTTLELAALQSYVDPEEMLVMHGTSDSAWRQRIGNMVPPDAAEAMGETIGRTLLAVRLGQTFMLSSEPIWVQPIAIGLSLRSEFE